MSEPAITPENGWPAQPGLTAREQFLALVHEDIAALRVIADTFEKPVLSRRLSVRDELRRSLAGVIGHCEALKLALDRGRA